MVRLVVVPVAVVAPLLGGARLLTANTVADRAGQILIGVAWFVLAGFVLGRALRGRAGLRGPARVASIATAVLALGAPLRLRSPPPGSADPAPAPDPQPAPHSEPAPAPAPEPEREPVNVRLASGAVRGVDEHAAPVRPP